MRHRGVKVRIVTNDFSTPDCAGTLTPLSYLALNGATVRWYNQTTFMHAKYVSIDGKRTSVSSINFSKTSFTRNREAGAVLDVLDGPAFQCNHKPDTHAKQAGGRGAG